MAFEETREQQNIYNLFRSVVYLTLIFELICNIPITFDDGISGFAFGIIKRVGLFESLKMCKIMEFTFVCVVAIGTTAKKSLNFDLKRMVIYPIIAGIILTVLCFIMHDGIGRSTGRELTTYRCLYAIFSVLGVMSVHAGLDALAKRMKHKVGEDRFNYENESFQQCEELIKNDYSVNIPMIYYWEKRMHKGWINIINPFRATLVLGTPGSGKSFGIIDPFIRQHSAKGFSMMVYDYKFPTLAKTLFYNYCKNLKLGLTPENMKFHVINFTDVEYSSRVNPIQRKYIPDLAAASETAATLLASLNKGGGDKKGGSEAFFTNSAENFLAAIIYFFVNLRPMGYKQGKKLRRFIDTSEGVLELKVYGLHSLYAVDREDRVILDFREYDGSVLGRDISMDEDGQPVELENLSYLDIGGELRTVKRMWYVDENGQEVEPDTITGEFSYMSHVLAFLGFSYQEVFDVLMMEPKIMSLMAPFKSAYKNKAMDQLEGMVGTLRVTAARLVTPESYWVFSGDDLDLKISDPKAPSYLVIANDPEKEQIMGALNALILNRLVTRVNSKGNLPVSLIVDELPTLYFHKVDRLIGTARSNKVSVTLGFQELPQLEADYGKTGMLKIITTCGNVFMGAARNKETLEWAQNDVFGKVKQISKSIAINDSKISTTLAEKMDSLVPASKIADMATGWLAGQSARDFTSTDDSVFNEFSIEDSEEFKTSKYFCKTHFDMAAIKREEKAYVELPKIYSFSSPKAKEVVLNRNFSKINKEVENLINEILYPSYRISILAKAKEDSDDSIERE